jgi:hypothetical protein
MNDKPYHYSDNNFGYYLLIWDKDDPSNRVEIRGKSAKKLYLKLVNSRGVVGLVINKILRSGYYKIQQAKFNKSLGTAVGED